jgi:capsular exopolysaccharide synthesis family protein
MNHMEAILQKAEREGALRRVSAPVDVAPPPPAAAPPIAPVHAGPHGPAPVSDATGPTAARPAATAPRPSRLDPLLVVASDPEGRASEQYRAIRTKILHADHGVSIRALLVTSPSHGDGKSLTAANLALTMARAYDHRVCLVDTDLRMPRQGALLGLPADAPGLSDVLAGHALLDDTLVRIDDYDLTVLPAGGCPPRPSELLGTAAMRRTADTLRARFDCVILDAPAVLPLSDVGALAPLVDSAVLVVRAGVTSKAAIRDAAAALGDTQLVGVILNDQVE